MMKTKQTNRKLLLVSRLLGLAALVVMAIGLAISWKQHDANRIAMQTAYQKEQATITTPETDTPVPPPDTEKPGKSEFEAYAVAPDAPRYIFISKIAVHAMVKPVRLTADNHIETPRNVFDTGWYAQSAKPGQQGAMVIGGHLSSWETRGVFYRLNHLKPGDTITIERGDGATLTYKTIKSHTYDTNTVDMNAVLRPIEPGKPGLNLITCAGKVIKGTNDFDKRLVIFAEQM